MKYRIQNLSDTRSSVLQKIRDPENTAAWQRFYDQYAGFVFTLARRSGLQHTDAEDVVQTVMLEMIESIRTFDRRRGRFRSWLATCARHRIIDLLRIKYRRKRREVGGFDRTEERTATILRQADTGPDRFKEMADEEWSALVRSAALKKTKAAVAPKQFSLFHAYAIEEWPVDKVITTYNVSRDQVYQAKRRVGKVYASAAQEAEQELDRPFCPGFSRPMNRHG